MGGASRQVTADLTEDPGAWTLGSTSVWTAYTIALYAAATDARVSQIPVEAVVQPDNAQARISQIPMEAVIQPDNAQARVSQVVIEAVIENVVVTGQTFRVYIID